MLGGNTSKAVHPTPDLCAKNHTTMLIHAREYARAGDCEQFEIRWGLGTTGSVRAKTRVRQDERPDGRSGAAEIKARRLKPVPPQSGVKPPHSKKDNSRSLTPHSQKPRLGSLRASGQAG